MTHWTNSFDDGYGCLLDADSLVILALNESAHQLHGNCADIGSGGNENHGFASISHASLRALAQLKDS
jgi:hypothetical protein